MTSPLFFGSLRGDLSLELFLYVHLHQATFHFFKLLHTGHHGNNHAAVLGPLFIKARIADAQRKTNVL
jgi:hypothetical protein